MAPTATLLTAEQAFAGRPPTLKRRNPKGPRRSGVRKPKDPRLLVTRPQGHARVHRLYIEPWVPVQGDPSIHQVIREIRQGYPRVYIPQTQIGKDWFLAHYEGSWHKFLRLEGRLHVRRLSGAWGIAKPRYMPCDCCFFRTDSQDLQRVAVGRTNATVQVFHVCLPCLNEGALERTSGKGFVAKLVE